VPLGQRDGSVITSPTSSGRSVGIVHSRTQATEFRVKFVEECKLWDSLLSHYLDRRVTGSLLGPLRHFCLQFTYKKGFSSVRPPL
jgi:hypothetical protein